MNRAGRMLLALAAAFLLPSAGECLRFAVVSDSQLTFDNPQAEPRILLRFLEDMKRQDPRPAFLLHSGDIITGWTSDRGALKEQYRQFRMAMKKAPFPFHIAMGNHEGYSAESVALFEKYFGPTFHSFDHDGWHFVLLDTGNDAHYGTLGPEQEAWLRRDLEKSRKMKGTFVAIHVPLFADDMEAWIEMDTAERDRLHALFLANNVKAVFQGHVHTYEMCLRDGIKYVIAGGGGGPLEHWPPVGHFYHYLLVDAEEGYLSILPRRMEEIDSEEEARNVPRPAPVRADPGAVLEGFEGGDLEGWDVYNDLVRTSSEGRNATEGRRSLRMEFDFAVSLWPILMRSSSTPWDMSGCEAVSVDVWASPSLYALKDEVVKVRISLGGRKSEPRELRRGEWTTLRWDFSAATWVAAKGGGEGRPLTGDDLKAVGDLSIAVVSDPTAPRKDWDRRMKGHILLDNLKAR